MQLAECQAVLDDWFSFGLRIGDDVCGVKEFLMPESAKSTLLAVGS